MKGLHELNTKPCQLGRDTITAKDILTARDLIMTDPWAYQRDFVDEYMRLWADRYRQRDTYYWDTYRPAAWPGIDQRVEVRHDALTDTYRIEVVPDRRHT